MAKIAVINRDLKRRETVKKFAARRAELLVRFSLLNKKCLHKKKIV